MSARRNRARALLFLVLGLIVAFAVSCHGVRIGDFVWLDEDRNGVQDVGEFGLPLVDVALIDLGTMTLVEWTMTDLFGYYAFEDVEPGNYAVYFHVFPVTKKDQDSDWIDSDANEDTHVTDPFYVDQDNLDIDCGVWINLGGFFPKGGNGVPGGGAPVPGVAPVFPPPNVGPGGGGPAGGGAPGGGAPGGGAPGGGAPGGGGPGGGGPGGGVPGSNDPLSHADAHIFYQITRIVTDPVTGEQTKETSEGEIYVAPGEFEYGKAYALPFPESRGQKTNGREADKEAGEASVTFSEADEGPFPAQPPYWKGEGGSNEVSVVVLMTYDEKVMPVPDHRKADGPTKVEPSGGGTGGPATTGGEPTTRWSALPEDVRDATARLGYKTGQEASPSEENWPASERRFNSKGDIKEHTDLWEDWKGTWMRDDARTIERFLIPAMGEEREQLVDLWQLAFNLGYGGGCFSCEFGIPFPND